MGLGEQAMKKWGYITASTGLVLAVFTFVICILTIVVIKTSVDINLKDNTFIFAIIVLLMSVTVGALGVIGIINIRKADSLYQKVSEEAASGKIAVARSNPVMTNNANNNVTPTNNTTTANNNTTTTTNNNNNGRMISPRQNNSTSDRISPSGHIDDPNDMTNLFL
jgi:hypothetical protein